MNYHITKKSAYSLGIVKTKSTGVVVVKIAIDIHRDNSLSDQAAYLIYPDALFAGAGKYDRAAFLNELGLLGSSFDASFTDGKLHLEIQSSKEAFPKLLKLVTIALEEPQFTASELKRISTTITNKLKQAQKKGAYVAKRELKNACYAAGDRRHTASHVSLIKKFSDTDKKTLSSLHERVLAKPWTVTIGGETGDVELVEKMVAKLKQGKEVPDEKVIHAQLPTKSALKLQDIPSLSNIEYSLGLSLPLYLHDDEYTPLSFALSVLGYPGFGSRLMQTIREKEGLTYGIYASLESTTAAEKGYVQIRTFFMPSKTVFALDCTFKQIAKLHKSGITTKEFDNFKKILKDKQVLLQDSLLNQVAQLHYYNYNGFTVEEIEVQKNKLDTITRSEVNKAIKKYLDPKYFVISGAGPVKAVQKDIQRFMKSVS